VTPRRVPGETGLWIFILGDLFVFGIFFILYARNMATENETFLAGQSALSQPVGLANTLLLLTGSLSVAIGVEIARKGSTRPAAAWIGGGALSGMIFLLLKAAEYRALIGAGHSLVSDHFFLWYFFLTGYHAVHVILGIFLLLFAAGRLRLANPVPSGGLLEGIACYWHMVDMLWIVIFALIYLL
jgi:nitric oxide reductase NorE protein